MISFLVKKRIEWRTRALPGREHFVYETKRFGGSGSVIGKYTCKMVVRFNDIDDIPEHFIRLGCVPISFLKSYSSGKPLYAHFISAPALYQKPVDYRLFCSAKAPYKNLERPPQSWCYVGLPLPYDWEVFKLNILGE